MSPADGIATEKMEIIAQYVRDVGGGLLMAGGDASFGNGGYYKTPISTGPAGRHGRKV